MMPQGVEQVYKNFLWAHKPWFQAKIDKKRTTCLGIAIKEAIVFTISPTIITSCWRSNKWMWEVLRRKYVQTPSHHRDVSKSCYLIWSCMLTIHNLFFLVNEFELCMYICKKLYIKLLLNIYLHDFFVIKMCTVSAPRMLISSFDL
jgi:hypothetical protein